MTNTPAIDNIPTRRIEDLEAEREAHIAHLQMLFAGTKYQQRGHRHRAMKPFYLSREGVPQFRLEGCRAVEARLGIGYNTLHRAFDASGVARVRGWVVRRVG